MTDKRFFLVEEKRFFLADTRLPNQNRWGYPPSCEGPGGLMQGGHHMSLHIRKPLPSFLRKYPPD